MLNATENNLWGIVLAGGSGVRLHSFVRTFYDHERPKQYCAFIGSRSMVQHTIDRVKTLIDQKHILTVAAEKHVEFVREQLHTFPIENLLIQPCCRETAPAILLPLFKIYRQYPGSAAAIFPSDHFILHESKFMRYVQQANAVVNNNPEIIVALGVRPDQWEDGYGWIRQGENVPSSDGLTMYRVQSFIEKPERPCTQWNTLSDCFLNTLVLIGKTGTLLKHFQRNTPQLYSSLSTMLFTGTPHEEHQVIKKAYGEIQSANFSRSILENIPDALRVVDISDVCWGDWGEEQRIRKDVERFHLTLNNRTSIALEA